MMATAIHRRPPVLACTHIITGHVATAMVVDQINAARNGHSVQMVPRSSRPMTSTSNTTRVMSPEGVGFIGRLASARAVPR